MFFNKSKPIAEGVIVGNRIYALSADPITYNSEISIALNLLKEWLTLEVEITNKTTNTSIGDILECHDELGRISILNIGDDLERSLRNILRDNERSLSGARFLETISLIYTFVNPKTIEVYSGRMYHSYINILRICTEKELAEFIHNVPWFWIIHLYQFMYNSYLDLNTGHIDISKKTILDD